MRLNAFTISEALAVLIIVGILGLLYSAGIKLYNPTQKGFDVQSTKILENLDQVFTLIFAKHSVSFTLEDLHDKEGNFSVTDENILPRFVEFFKENLQIMDIDDSNIDKVKEYYASQIIDYKRVPTGLVLKDTYSNFITTQNGTIYGFRLYKSCTAQEKNANPPLEQDRRTVNNICGSIFYDVNNYKGPNKLGSDQYIIPFDVDGTEVKK